MILITGACGFIGSNLVAELNDAGIDDLILADEFNIPGKTPNYNGKKFKKAVGRMDIFEWLVKNNESVSFVFHLGARTDTTTSNWQVLELLNLNYSKAVWHYCSLFNIPLVYASSAATYGRGEAGYSDAHETINTLQPLNLYGKSKNEFDKWALKQKYHPPNWVGLKFFNVYGPNEYHKKRMASVIYHAYQQIKETGTVKLFRSHRQDYADGAQLRDFIYVKDIMKVCIFLLNHKVPSGIYNAGTGVARSFLDLAKAVFVAMKKPESIAFIDIPLDIRENYQYHTQADITKLRAAGFTSSLSSLEEGIDDYVNHYLTINKYR